MKRFFLFAVPLVVVVVIAIVLARGLHLHPQELPSALLNKPIPNFSLPTVMTNSEFTQADLQAPGEVAIVHVWATWCTTCRAEHQFWNTLKKPDHVNLFSLLYKDEREKAKDWLTTFGNPYKKVGDDHTGRVALDWGVYGTPETYIIDSHGVIRYKQVGEVSPQLWQNTMLPLITQLQHEQ